MSPRLRTTRDDHHDRQTSHHLPSCMSLLFSFSLLHITPLILNPSFFLSFSMFIFGTFEQPVAPPLISSSLSYPLPPIYIFIVCTNVNNIHHTRATSICDSHGMCSTMISFVSTPSFTSSESLSLSFMLLLSPPPFPSFSFHSFLLPLLRLVSHLINYTGVVVQCHDT